ncbi:SUF system Fe-S cluster assembly regulator [Lysobacter sp. HA18]
MLRVTKLTDYATVVLTVLAAARGEVLSATEIADRAGLEATTVSKVLKPLAQAALVEGFRGAHGGYRLGRPARDVALIEVIEAMEGPLSVTECSVHEGHCGIESSCGTRRGWRRINDVITQSLRAVTLQDLLDPEPDPRATRRIAVRLASA